MPGRVFNAQNQEFFRVSDGSNREFFRDLYPKLHRTREEANATCTAREKKRMHKRPIYVEIL